MHSLLLEEFALTQIIVTSGQHVGPRFAILAPEREFTVFVPLPDDVHARARGLAPMRALLAWKAATGFVLSIETWLGPIDAPQDEDLVPRSRYQPNLPLRRTKVLLTALLRNVRRTRYRAAAL